MKTIPCYQCGFCCEQSQCGYGEWNATKNQCNYLNENKTCSRYEYIVECEKNSMFPMMGCGCSSPLFNEKRNAKMKALGINPQDEQKEIEKSIGINLDFSPNFDKLWEKMEKRKRNESTRNRCSVKNR